MMSKCMHSIYLHPFDHQKMDYSPYRNGKIILAILPVEKWVNKFLFSTNA